MAGHSYTDAALNTSGLLLDTTGMRRIIAWDPEQGIMQVEPGVTLRDVVRISLPDRWWPAVTPSTADATIGGCVAMNVNGKNAWKTGSFGEHLLSLTVLLAGGQLLTLSPEQEPELFRAFVGSAGLLGIIISITFQLQRIPSGYVDVHVQPASSLGELLRILEEEQSADYLEAWVDGFAGGRWLGRGIVTATTYSHVYEDAGLWPATAGMAGQLKASCARQAGILCRPVVKSGVRLANDVMYWEVDGGNASLFDKDRWCAQPIIQRPYLPVIELCCPWERNISGLRFLSASAAAVQRNHTPLAGAAFHPTLVHHQATSPGPLPA
ncbi:FAD-binding oxidoreductase [Dictyobacter kobayashii]|uniref:FAD-binding PCMH-type domain-containing protein n=1 Tax=Dictyobacter kobayashii TaxID=2014872 RepID=A0A402AR34_9CHLR|nr:FAD-binding oxidoreductase [Dictyobacter kobayashii]GCE21555.1 hypothetical protein KDK_53550 [Dictyobacter kobayashii]